MRRKFSMCLVLILTSVLFVFSSEASALVSVASSSIPEKLNPIYKGFGSIVSEDSSDKLKYFALELKKTFSFEWTEDNFEENVKVMLSKVTPFLSDIMPIKTIVFSKPIEDEDTISFSFMLTAKDDRTHSGAAVIENKDDPKILAFTLDNN